MEAHDLRAIQVLLAVHDEGGFAAAARRLGVTRAAVSRSIAQLEARLGASLARRTTRRVVLTDAALALVGRCAGPIRAMGDALDAASEQDSGLAGAVRISGSAAFGRDVLVPTLMAFRTQNPEVTVELTLGDRVEDLVARPIDVAVRIGPLPDTSVVARSVGQLPLVAVAAPALVEQHGPPRAVDQLAAWPAVVFRVAETGQRYPWPFEHRGSTVLFAPSSVAFESDSIDAVAELVRRGAGVSVVPRHVVEADLASGRLVALLQSQVAAGPRVSVCYPQRKLMPRRVRALVDHLVRELPAWCAAGRSRTTRSRSPRSGQPSP